MTLESMSSEQHIALIRKKGELLPPIAKRWGDRIFEEIMQGDEFIDEVNDLQADLDLLSNDNPEEDIIYEGELIDALWHQMITQIHHRIGKTMTRAREEGQS